MSGASHGYGAGAAARSLQHCRTASENRAKGAVAGHPAHQLRAGK